MDTSVPTQEINCTQCGGELHPGEGQVFLTCPYCSATVYLDKARVVFHWYLASTLDETKALGALMRWMAGNQTVKDLDKKSQVVSNTFEYFPTWYFKHKAAGGQEAISLLPAAATSVTEINRIKLPAGDLRKYDASINAQSQPPSVPLQTALAWLEEKDIQAGDILEQSLVHVPLYTLKYNYNGSSYTAIVEGGTGGVFANIFPAKSEIPYRTIGLITALVFLCLAIVPLAMTAGQGAVGTGTGLLICAGLGVVFVPILFAIAAYIAQKN